MARELGTTGVGYTEILASSICFRTSQTQLEQLGLILLIFNNQVVIGQINLKHTAKLLFLLLCKKDFDCISVAGSCMSSCEKKKWRTIINK